MAEDNIYEKIDEENLYEKPSDEMDASANKEEPKYENQSMFSNDAPVSVTDAIYSEIDVKDKAGRSLSPEYMNTNEATEEAKEVPSEVQNGVGLYEVPSGENGEEVLSRRSSASSTEHFGELCDEEQLQEATYEDNADDGMMMAYSLPKGRAAEPEEEVVDYSLKPVQNNNVEDEEEEEKPVDPSQPEITLFVKVGPRYYTLSYLLKLHKNTVISPVLNEHPTGFIYNMSNWTQINYEKVKSTLWVLIKR